MTSFAVIRLPRLSNFTDLDALAIEPGVSVRFVEAPGELGRPDLVILPGTKATVADLAWLRGRRLDAAIAEVPALVLGICGGYQMLGRTITDEVESGDGTVEGLGMLDITTWFAPGKVTRQRRGTSMGHAVSGYEIHHGVIDRGPGSAAWIHLDDTAARGDERAGRPHAADACVASLLRHRH